MLQKLSIQNYAIIHHLETGFAPTLNIITGETGAGKSILIGALGLVLGDRADSSALGQTDKKLVVEAQFATAKNNAVQLFLKQQDLDADAELLIRREIAATGKSRAFVNDTPVTLAQLKKLGSLLVDLHQQFDTLELGDNDFQRQVLDALAGNMQLVESFADAYHNWYAAQKQLAELQAAQQAANSAADYHRFLFEELEELNLQPNELENLDAELKLLNNAENIKQQLAAIYYSLTESEQPIVPQLKQLLHKLNSLSDYHAGISVLGNRLQTVHAELADIAAETDAINQKIGYDPEKLQWINDRVAAGYKLQKKHGVQSTDALLEIKAGLSKKLSDILQLDQNIAAVEKQVTDCLAVCNKQAAVLQANRQKAIPAFEKKVNELLAKVGMPNARFKVGLQQVSLYQFGIDEVQFLFNANTTANDTDADKRFEPLRKVASGGELSRIMLCIKSLVAQKLQLPTLIFDEIDTGISGEAARQAGEIMKSLSTSLQLIAITHQPQIAARADAHYFVHKAISGHTIQTAIRLLNNDERITAIAQMLSGEKPTAAALQNAREMVGN
jgi:DNA repair protein RecN (Recombination protein N)